MNGISALVFGTLLSMTIAVLGNSVGRYIGRRKLSVWNLRPRHTSTLITVCTGGLIFVVTVLGLTTVSEPVRKWMFERDQALAEMNDAMHQRDAMQAALGKAQMDYAETMRRINENMWKYKANTPLYFTNQIVYLRLVDCDVPRDLIEEQIDSLLSEANRIVVARKNEYAKRAGEKPLPEDQKVVGIAGGGDTKLDLLDQLANMHEKRLVLLRAPFNLWVMDEAFPMNFEVRPVLLCYKKGEVIASTRFRGVESRVEVVQQMQQFLSVDAKKKISVAKQRGLIQDELIFDLPLSTLVNAQDKIVAAHRPVTLNLVASHDIYNFDVGHLDAGLRVATK